MDAFRYLADLIDSGTDLVTALRLAHQYSDNGYLNEATLWDDNTAEIAIARGAASAPGLTDFGPDSITQEYEFNRGEGVVLRFHIKHEIKPGSKIYPHVHWSTDGTAATADSTDVVEWVLDGIVAKGHNQESFTALSQITLTQSVYNDVSVGPTNPDAWHHYIVEASDAQAWDAPEVDSLVIVRLVRGSTSDTYSNATTGHVFGLYMDLHYQKDRSGTLNKAPDFYQKS